MYFITALSLSCTIYTRTSFLLRLHPLGPFHRYIPHTHTHATLYRAHPRLEMTYIGRSESSDAEDEIQMFVDAYADDDGAEQPVSEDSDLENIYDSYASLRTSSGSPIVGGDDDIPYEGIIRPKQTATTDGQGDRNINHNEVRVMTEQEPDQVTDDDEEETLINFEVVSPTDDLLSSIREIIDPEMQYDSATNVTNYCTSPETSNAKTTRSRQSIIEVATQCFGVSVKVPVRFSR
ncbi:hypothetical protein CPC08DRAFT_726000 [Agrocybe pediades]|nr:hypothetical protein CPC08DRAFT_726000 [Agrocybe pediades]